MAKIQTIDGVPPENTSAKKLTKPRHPKDGGSKISLLFWTYHTASSMSEKSIISALPGV
jgi:hypothetical protein